MTKFLMAPTLAAALLSMAAPAARASSISFLDSFKNLSDTQTGNGNTLTSNGGFYSADLTESSPNAYTTVTMAFPGAGSPIGLSPISPTVFEYESSQFATKAAMDVAFPLGTYSFTGTNGATNDAASYQYTADDYAQSMPFLTGTDFTSLQGMNAAQAFTFHFSPFVTGSTASSSFIFLNIFDTTTNSSAFSSGFLSSNTAALTLAANTLTAGDSYAYELDFSNRDNVASPGADFAASLGFDVRTDGAFTAAAATATPEPSTLALASFALIVGAIGARKRATRE